VNLIAQINHWGLRKMGVELLQMLTTSDYASVISMNLFVALLCACIVIGHLLEENRWVNESITALLLVSLTYFAIHFYSVNHWIKNQTRH